MMSKTLHSLGVVALSALGVACSSGSDSGTAQQSVAVFHTTTDAHEGGEPLPCGVPGLGRG